MNTKMFFLHHLPAVERKNTLTEVLQELELNYPVEWVEEFLPENILGKYQHSITLKELSLSLKHQYAISKQIEHNIQNIIIFEDDIDLKSLPQLSLYLEQCLNDITVNNGDVLWIGGTYGLQVPPDTRQNDRISYFSEKFLSRCTHGYILNIKAAPTVLSCYNYDLPVDHLFNQIILRNKLISGWTAPFLTQKTVEGKWKSYIR